MKNKLKNIVKNQDAIIALEMALILPILLLLFFGMLEYNRAYFHYQKANKISGTVADMIAMFEPIPYQKTLEEIETECNALPFMITEKRLKSILDNRLNGDGTNALDPIEALALPIDAEKVVVHITAVSQDGDPALTLPTVAWKFSYTRNPSSTLGYTFPSLLGEPSAIAGQKGDVVDFSPITGHAHLMYQDEVMIIVEAGVAYKSITGGLLDAIITPLNDGWIRSNSFYAARNYFLDSDGNIQRSIKNIWPTSLPSPDFTGQSTANPQGC